MKKQPVNPRIERMVDLILSQQDFYVATDKKLVLVNRKYLEEQKRITEESEALCE